MPGHGCWVWVWGPEALVLAWSKQRSAQQRYLKLDLPPGLGFPPAGSCTFAADSQAWAASLSAQHCPWVPPRWPCMLWKRPWQRPPLALASTGLCPSSRPRPGTGSASHFLRLPSPICGAWYSSTHMGHSRTTWGLKVLGKGFYKGHIPSQLVKTNEEREYESLAHPMFIHSGHATFNTVLPSGDPSQP